MYSQEFFYTAEPDMKSVSKKEFEEFIEKYPRPLDRDVYGVCEPPCITYNDFELANRWPYSVVARTWFYEDDPKGYYYTPPHERHYYIMVNYEEVFKSKTGNEA